MDQSGGEITLHRSQYHPRPARSGEGTQSAESLIRYMAWNLGVHDSKTFEQRGCNLWPQLTIGAPNYDKPLGSDTGLPSHRRTKPSPDVEHRYWFGSGGGGQQRDSERGEPTTRRSDQPQYPSRLDNEIDDGSLRSLPPTDGALLRRLPLKGGVMGGCECEWRSQGTIHPNRTYVRLQESIQPPLFSPQPIQRTITELIFAA